MKSALFASLLFAACLVSVLRLASSQDTNGNAATQPQPQRVRVGIPLILDFDLLTVNGTDTKKTVMDLGVLSGLVRVNLDRTTNSTTGKRTGPISVSIFGQKVYGDRRRRR